jgi:type IV fimbrial biogenesis protein FimT
MSGRTCRRVEAGFSLVELMVVVTILAIVASIGSPAMSSLIAGYREKTAASALQESLILARAEALKRNATVTLSSTDLAAGWTVTLADGSVLRTQEGFTSLSFAPAAINIAYTFQGRRPVGAATTTVVISSSLTAQCRQVRIDTNGRASISDGC